MLSIFGNLFKKKKQQGGVVRDVLSLTSEFAKPAIQVMRQEHASLSHFGGSPNLPAGTEWPEKNGKRLQFLARVSLAEIHRAEPIEWLARTGALLFFYDLEQQPWGFDPKDRGGWAVIYVPDLKPVAFSDGANEDSPVPFTHIGFRRIDSFPSYEREAIAALGLTDEEAEKYWEITDLPYQGTPKHQISGFPAPVQGDGMELECQLVSNGLYCGDPTGYNDPRVSSLSSGAENWRLLFQFDTDDDLNMMWGDCGTIYYWVDEQSARTNDFSSSWLILQCS